MDINIVKKEDIDIKKNKLVGKAIQCKQCEYTVEGRNLAEAVTKMALHKQLFKEPATSIRTFNIYE
jgi:hypothetical protein